VVLVVSAGVVCPGGSASDSPLQVPTFGLDVTVQDETLFEVQPSVTVESYATGLGPWVRSTVSAAVGARADVTVSDTRQVLLIEPETPLIVRV
jgi:hypothetical protein